MSTSIQEQDLIQTIKHLEQRVNDLERQQRTIGSSGSALAQSPNQASTINLLNTNPFIILADPVGTPNARGLQLEHDKISLQGSNGAGDIQGPNMDITWDSWSLQINFPSVALYRGFTDPIVVETAVPATPTSVGSPGEIAANNTHLYVCTATNTWRRVALSTF